MKKQNCVVPNASTSPRASKRVCRVPHRSHRCRGGHIIIISKQLGPQKPFQSRPKGALRDQRETSLVELCAIKTPLIKTVWLNCTPWRERRRPWIMFHNRQTPRSEIFSQGTLKTRESVSMPSPLATWKKQKRPSGRFLSRFPRFSGIRSRSIVHGQPLRRPNTHKFRKLLSWSLQKNEPVTLCQASQCDGEDCNFVLTTLSQGAVLRLFSHNYTNTSWPFHPIFTILMFCWFRCSDRRLDVIIIIVIIIHRFYTALFFVLEQTHCAHVACDSESVTEFLLSLSLIACIF